VAISGTLGSVLVGGISKAGDKWSWSGDQAAVDRANFQTLGEPLNAAGQRTGEVTFEGPVEGVVGIERGLVYLFKLGVTNTIGVAVSGRVTNVTFTNDAKDGPRFSVKAAQFGAASIIGM
jgi:hypothetical protein